MSDILVLSAPFYESYIYFMGFLGGLSTGEKILGFSKMISFKEASF